MNAFKHPSEWPLWLLYLGLVVAIGLSWALGLLAWVMVR